MMYWSYLDYQMRMTKRERKKERKREGERNTGKRRRESEKDRYIGMQIEGIYRVGNIKGRNRWFWLC